MQALRHARTHSLKVGDGLVGRVPAAQKRGTEFHPGVPVKKPPTATCVCKPGAGSRLDRCPRAQWLVSQPD